MQVLRCRQETSSRHLPRFFHKEIILEFWLLTPQLFVSGHLLGRWHNRRWRRERMS